MQSRLFVSVLLTLLCAGLTAGDKHDPQTELDSFTIAEGYQVNLFASEKDGIINPIQCRFDSRGRLWVACSLVYPQIEPGEKANDKIIVLEDTDGDGKADKSTVFADGLMIPTGLEFGNGGVYVGQSTELLHLKDTDGDGKADTREVVFSGFGVGDTHQNINSFIWGPGGEMFFCQGLHAVSRVETPWGIEKLDKAGYWRFRPKQLRLDPFLDGAMGSHNPWGVEFDDWGQPFSVTGNGHGIYYVTPATIRTSHFLVFPQIWDQYRKHCGMDIIGNSHMPENVQGIMVAGGYLNRLVSWFQLVEEGSGYRAKEVPPLIVSSHDCFRPVDVRIGPDGAIYLADWYNPIIGHYQTSFRHPDRDKTHGRIWRVTAKNRPLAPKPDYANKKPAELLEFLKSPERWHRQQAKRILADTEPAQVSKALKKWIEKLDDDDAKYEHHLYEALGVYESIEVVEPALLEKLLRAKDYRVRAYATRVIGHWHNRLANPLALLERQAADEHARVRLEAVVSCSYVPAARSLEIAASVVDQPMDKFLDYALIQTVHALRPHWLPAYKSGSITFEQRINRLEFVLRADGTPETIQPVWALIASGQLDEARTTSLLSILANIGGPKEIGALLTPAPFTISNAYNAELHAKILPLVRNAVQARKIRPDGDVAAALGALLQNNHEPLRSEALRLAGVLKAAQLQPQLMALAEAKDAPATQRDAAIQALGKIGGAGALEVLKRLADGNSNAITALVALDVNAAAAHAASRLSGGADDNLARGLFTTFLQHAEGADALAEALTKKAPKADAAKVGLRLMGSIGRQDPALLKVLNLAAGIDDEVKQLSPAEFAALAKEVTEQGNAARGEAIFRRQDANCVSCHAIGGAGGTIGPDLSAMGTSQPLDFILGAVLYPNKEVKEGFSSYRIVTKDGVLFEGQKVREDGKDVILRETVNNTEVRIAGDNIKKQVLIGSVMPANITNQLTRAELRDMVRYLVELGRPGPYGITTTPVVRHWRLLTEIPSNFNDTGPVVLTMKRDQWKPLMSRTSGALGFDDLKTKEGQTHAVIDTAIQSTVTGKYPLHIKNIKGLRGWMNGQPLELKEQMSIELEAGRHDFTLLIDLKAADPQGVRVEAPEVSGVGRLVLLKQW